MDQFDMVTMTRSLICMHATQIANDCVIVTILFFLCAIVVVILNELTTIHLFTLCTHYNRLQSMVTLLWQRRTVKYLALIIITIAVFKYYVLQNWSVSKQKASQLNNAETTHIGVAVTHHAECRHIPLLIKSVLMHQQNPVHFHFLTDITSKRILQAIVQSWKPPRFATTFYAFEGLPYRSNRSPASPLNAFDTLAQAQKLKILTFVPPKVQKIVSMEANVVVMQAIDKFQWDPLKGEHLVGDLKDSTNNVIESSKVLLVSISASSELGLSASLYSLRWGIHPHCLSTTEGESKCNSHDMVHLLDEKAKKPTEQLIKEVVLFDGYKLQEQIAHDHSKDTASWGERLWSWLVLSCHDFHMHTFRIHPYYIGKTHQPSDEYDVTLITQLSLDRMPLLEMILELWDGPLSASLYVEESQILELLRIIHDSSVLQRENVAIHVVYKKQETNYPINFLRNLAWSYSNSPYVFLNDVDLIPSKDTYLKIRQALRHSPLINAALVVPAFETAINGLLYPESKQHLKELIRQEKVTPWRVSLYAPSHGPTDYDQWLETSQPYEIQWKYNYEPYVVVAYDSARYDERFVGYGKNKVLQIEELHAQGYSFIVLPDVYIIHYPHTPTLDQAMFMTKALDRPYYRCIIQLETAFLKDLKQKYEYIRTDPKLIH